MRITADGRVTIPEELREQFGLLPDTEVQFEPDGDAVRIRPASAESAEELTPGERAVARLRDAGRRHWVGPATTEDVMALMRGHRGDPGLPG